MSHNPYFNRWFSAIVDFGAFTNYNWWVTILILIDGFLQYKPVGFFKNPYHSHNPYFNRWFSAIQNRLFICWPFNRHNPYFNRWFSAIIIYIEVLIMMYLVTILILIDGFLQLRWCLLAPFSYICHNPYFNRWFSAIKVSKEDKIINQ